MTVFQARARVANESKRARRGASSPGAVEAARRDLAEAKVADYVARVLAEAPPLTEGQLDRLCALMHQHSRRDAR